MYILSRQRENELVSVDDGTCCNEDKCRVFVDNMTSNLAGTAIIPGGPCVLCCRWYVFNCFTKGEPLDLNKHFYYRNIDGEYPNHAYIPFTPSIGLTFPFVSYASVGWMPSETTDHTNFFKIFEVVETKNISNPSSWFIMNCKKCSRVANIMDIHHATGFKDAFYDFDKDAVCCKTCKQPFNKHFNDAFGNVMVENKWFSKCYFCDTTTETKFSTIQVCRECHDEISNLLNKSNKQCFYCEELVNDKKKSTSYQIIDDKGEHKTVYLCKPHTIPRRVLKKFKQGENVIDQQTFVNMLTYKKRKN